MGSSNTSRATVQLVACALLLATPPPVPAQENTPQTRPQTRAQRLDAAPVVDGNVIDDPAWRGVSAAQGFWQVRPDDGEPSTQRTNVFVGFTDRALYVGVVAYDDEPTEIIVTDSRRDTSLDDTDAFLFVIDGLLDRQNGFVFGTNPAGIEYDGQVTGEGVSTSNGFEGGGLNLNWDGSWSVQTRSGSYGWSAEFEIPFSTLRFASAGKQDWGINFQRNIRRNNEVTYWAPLSRDRNLYRVSEAGTLLDIAPPPQRNLQITPYVLGSAERGGTLNGTETGSEAGVDVKYSVTPSLTLDLTVNTDFAQVEADNQQINLDRFNLFYPEKRPFFLENAGLFAVGNAGEVELFFSRRIGISDDGDIIPVDGGARLSGKLGSSTNIGLLYMGTEGVAGLAPRNRYAVARVNQELANRSSIGAIFVDRDGDGSNLVPEAEDYNRSYAIDGRWGIGDHIMIDGWLARTDTPGLDGDDHALGLNADYSSAKWNYTAEYAEVRENFNPEVGFLQRSEYRKARFYVMRRIRPDKLWGLLEIRPHMNYSGYWKFDGFQESGFLHLDTHWEYQSGTQFQTGINFTRAGVLEPFEIVDGVVIQPGTYDHEEVQLVYFTNRSRPLSFGISLIAGGRFGGDRVFVAPNLSFRIGETFRSEFWVDYNDFDLPVPNGKFTASLAAMRLSYSFTPKMQLQALVQYNDVDRVLGTNIRFSWLRTANSGLYLVYNEIDERAVMAPPKGREFIVKYSHIFDVFN